MREHTERNRGRVWGVLAASILVAGTLSSCATEPIPASGNTESESRPVAGFEAIDLRSPGNLVAEVGPETSLTVDADSNLIDRITTEVANGVLVIDVVPRTNFDSWSGVTFRVTAPNINALAVTGSGSMTVSNLSGNHLSLELKGSGAVSLHGVMNTLEMDIVGSGRVDTRDLRTDDVTIQTEGSGTADVTVRESIRTSISGSSRIAATGTAQETDITIEGSGDFDGNGLTTALARVTIEGSGTAHLPNVEELAVSIAGSGEVTGR